MALRQIPLIVVIGLMVPGEVRSQSLSHIDVNARVYDAANVSSVATGAALDVAARALAGAAVAVVWRQCDRGCSDTIEAGELIVRLVRSPATRPQDQALGDAFVEATTGTGVLATIYVDRVERLAKLSDTDMATLLGRAIAHEIGHLLLASSSHSSTGLMRAKWSRDELRRERLVDWAFTRKDAAAMRTNRRGLEPRRTRRTRRSVARPRRRRFFVDVRRGLCSRPSRLRASYFWPAALASSARAALRMLRIA